MFWQKSHDWGNREIQTGLEEEWFRKGFGGITLTLESDRPGFESQVVMSTFLPLIKFLNDPLSFCLICEMG